jgi:uncharacterized phage protein gp47/JayE
MPFDRPSLQEIIDRMKSDCETRIDGASSLLRRSVINVLTYVFGGAVHLLYGYLDYISKQIFATTADTENLAVHGSENSLPKTPASKASGTCSTTGTNGTTIEAGTQLQSSSGVLYETDEDVVVAGGVASLDITAVEAGSDGNDDGGITLTFVSPISGVSSSATVDSNGLAGGADEESDDDYRERILFKKRNPLKGGCETDFENWMKEISGVTRVWVFPLYDGDGTVGIAFTRDNDTTIIPNATQRDEAEEYLIEHEDPLTGITVGVPVTAEPGLRMISLSEVAVNFDISIYPNSAAVRAEVEEQLEDLIYDCGPGQTLYLSDISEAISLSVTEERHKVNTPAADTSFAEDELPVLGTITWSSY